MRRPRRIAEPGTLVLLGELGRGLDRARMTVHRRVRVASLAKPRRHRLEREVARLARVDLVPGERRGDARVGPRADRVRARDRAVLRVLVVIQKDAMTFLFPPLAG